MHNVVILGKSMMYVIRINAVMLNVIIINVIFAECHYAMRFCVEFLFAECYYAEFCFACSAECRGNNFKDSLLILRQKIVHH
jgi:hypothetical protein